MHTKKPSSLIDPRQLLWFSRDVSLLFTRLCFCFSSAILLAGVELPAQGRIPEPPAKELDLSIPDITVSEESRYKMKFPPVEIVPEFQLGCTYRFNHQLEVRLQFPGRGGREIYLEQQSRFDAGIRKDGKKGVSLTGRTERLKMDLKSREQTVTYDSLEAKDRKTPLGQHLNQSLTQWVELKLNKDNRIVSEDFGGNKANASPLEGFPQFGTGDLKRTVTVVMQAMPEKKVRPGDTWTVTGARMLSGGGEAEIDIACTFRGEVMHDHNRYLQIDLSGQVNGDVPLPSEEESAGGGNVMTFQVPSLAGKILYDPLEKMVRLSEQTLTMLVEVPMGAGVPSLKVPMQQKSSISLLHIIPTP